MHDNGLLGSAKPGHTKPNDQRLTVAIKARGPILKFVWTKCVCQLSLLLFSLLVWMKNWVRLMHCCQTRHNIKCTEYRYTSASIIESKVPAGGFLLPKVTNSSTATNTKTTCLQISWFIFVRSLVIACRRSVLAGFSDFSLSNSDWSFSHSRFTVFWINKSHQC